MNKVIMVMICIVVILGAVITAIVISKPNENENIEIEQTKVSEEKILDDCTEEYEGIENSNMIETNANEEKISPNCSITYKKYYKECGHTTNEYNNIPKELINFTEEELKEKYSDWQIEKFSSNEIILYKEIEGSCNEHFVVREKDGKVVIYKILENGEEEEIEVTQISTDYLTETDKMEMEKGIKVNGKQELNKLIEDFE